MNTNNKITTYPYRINIFKICENERLLKNKFHEGLNNKSYEVHVSKNNSQALRNESRILRNNLQANRDNSQVNRDKLHEPRMKHM